MVAYAAKGTLIKRSVDGGNNYTDVFEVTDINIDGNADEIDGTSHSSAGAFKEKLISLLDFGVSFDVNFHPGNATLNGTNGLINDWKTRTSRYFKIVFPASVGGGEYIFQGNVTNWNAKAPVQDKLAASFTLSNAIGAPTLP